jgi:hypothetical protein
MKEISKIYSIWLNLFVFCRRVAQVGTLFSVLYTVSGLSSMLFDWYQFPVEFLDVQPSLIIVFTNSCHLFLLLNGWIYLHLQGDPIDCYPPIWLQFCSMAVDPPLTSWPNIRCRHSSVSLEKTVLFSTFFTVTYILVKCRILTSSAIAQVVVCLFMVWPTSLCIYLFLFFLYSYLKTMGAQLVSQRVMTNIKL